MLSPTENPAVQFLNADQTQVMRLETPQEERVRKSIYLINNYGSLATKALLVAPVVGGALTALSVVAGLAAVAYVINNKLIEKAACNTEGWQSKIAPHIQDPEFLAQYDRLAQTIGLDETPPLVLSEKNPLALNVTYAGNGKKALEIGKDMFTRFDSGQLKAMIVHEMAHIKLNHTKGRINQMPVDGVGRILSIAAVGVALTGALPLVPVMGALIGLRLLHRAVQSSQNREKEKICDRAANIVCGNGKDLISGLKKYRILISLQTKPKQTAFKKLLKLLPEKMQPAVQQLRDYIERNHPSTTTRENLLHAFEDRHAAFCESRRDGFRTSFNEAAPKPVVVDLSESYSNPMNYQLKKIS